MANKKDNLGDRMKENYESRTRTFLPRRTYSIIRIDGKAFHTYTKGLERPFDMDLINDMDETARYLCQNIQGAKFAFVQSDEISILLTDFGTITTDAWYGGNVQKIVSVSASIATAKFNQLRFTKIIDLELSKSRDVRTFIIESANNLKLAMFDSRVFIIPDPIEVENYFIWRQQDTVRNSISSVVQSLYSHKELHNKNTSEMQEMCFKKGVNWNDFDPKLKRGRLIIKKEYSVGNVLRNKWVSSESPIFTQERDLLSSLIPKIV